MVLTFDTHEAIRKLRGKGHSESQAEGVVEFVSDATGELLTRDYFDAQLDARDGSLRAELYRALWIQGAGIVTINAAIIAAVVTLTETFG